MIGFARWPAFAICGMVACACCCVASAIAFADVPATVEAAAPLGTEESLLESSPVESTNPPVVLTTEILDLQYFCTVVVVQNSPVSEIAQKLTHQIQTSTNADFLASTANELHVLNLVWDTSLVDTAKLGVTSLDPTMSFADDVVWGGEPPVIWTEVVVVEPNSPTLGYVHLDTPAQTLSFPWAGIDAATFDHIKVRICKEDEPGISLDGEEGSLGSVTPEGVVLFLDRFERGASHTLEMEVGKSVYWQSLISFHGGSVVSVSSFGGDRDGGDSMGNGPSTGEQPSTPDSDGELSPPGSDDGPDSSGSTPLESYGPSQVTIGGSRANDLAAQQDPVVFDFANEVVSVSSDTIEALDLKKSDALTVESSTSGAASLTSVNGNPVDLQASASPTQQGVRPDVVSGFGAVGLVVLALLSLATGLLYVAYQIIRRQRVRL